MSSCEYEFNVTHRHTQKIFHKNTLMHFQGVTTFLAVRLALSANISIVYLFSQNFYFRIIKVINLRHTVKTKKFN